MSPVSCSRYIMINCGENRVVTNRRTTLLKIMSNVWTKIKILYINDKIFVNPNIEGVIYILLYHIYLVPTSTYIGDGTMIQKGSQFKSSLF